MVNLIKKIEDSIKTANEYKEKSTLGLIGSGILGVIGISGGIYTRNGKTVWYGVSAVTNVISALCHCSTINESADIINGLREIINAASEQKKKIKEEMDNMLNLLNSLNGNYPKYK